MRVLIVGAGPAGLLTALLLKKGNPRFAITLVDRRAPAQRPGSGIVLSDATFRLLRRADPPTFQALDPLRERWTRLALVSGDARVSIARRPLCGLARGALVAALQRRCVDVGVDMQFGRAFTGRSGSAAFDVTIGADGAKSAVRRAYAREYRPRLSRGGNRYAWLGTAARFSCMTVSVQRSPDGVFIGSGYRFSPDRSAMIVECSPSTWARARFATMSMNGACRYLSRVFAADLDGAVLEAGDGSGWREFTAVRTATCAAGPAVLIGDALHATHFSLGAGTALALGDAVALSACLLEGGSIARAIARFGRLRRPVLRECQTAAAASARFFDAVARARSLDSVPRLAGFPDREFERAFAQVQRLNQIRSPA